MSTFSVVTSQVQDMAGRLSSIASDADELCSQLAKHASAAADTSADGAMQGLMNLWSTKLPQYGQAGQSLQSAMLAAGTAYDQTDANVGATAGAA